MSDASESVAVAHATSSQQSAFLSYASADCAIADSVCAHLEAAGLHCWIAPRDVPAGAQYADAIVRAINAADALVLILSVQSVNSGHGGKEIERASSKAKPVIALRLDDTPLTPALEYFLSESQWIDARPGMPGALAKLTEGLRRLAAGDAAPNTLRAARTTSPPRTADPRQTQRTLLITAVSVIALLGAWFVAEKYWWSRGPHTPGIAAGTSAAVASRSIAVLPFTDLSQKKDQEYFSDGLSEELIDLLGKVPGLRVPARTSSFYFKGKQTTLAEIGRALNVTHVLEGSVRKSGDAIRVTTELVAVADDARVWSQTYDRRLDDVFKLQDDIAGSVVDALKVTVLGEPARRAAPTTNTEAYLVYLQAKQIAAGASPGDTDRAIALLAKAVMMDPDFAEAWATLGNAYIGAFAGNGRSNYAQARRDAMSALDHALALQPDLAHAHTALARLYYMLDWDAAKARAEIARAAAAEPANNGVLWLRGYIANSEGRFDEAIELHRRSRDADPLAVDSYRQLGNAYYRARRLDEAVAILSDANLRFPNAGTVHYRLGLALLAQGHAQAALREFELEPNPDFHKLGTPLALDALGRRAESDRILAQALADAHCTDGAAYQIALVYAARHDDGHALDWLERAWRQRDAGMHWMQFDPLLASLRTHPRFTALLTAMRPAA